MGRRIRLSVRPKVETCFRFVESNPRLIQTLPIHGVQAILVKRSVEAREELSSILRSSTKQVFSGAFDEKQLFLVKNRYFQVHLVKNSLGKIADIGAKFSFR